MEEVTLTLGPLTFSYWGGSEGINPFGKGWHGVTWGVARGMKMLPVGREVFAG